MQRFVIRIQVNALTYIFLKFLENLTLYLKFSFDKVFIDNFVLNSPNKYNFSLKCFKII